MNIYLRQSSLFFFTGALTLILTACGGGGSKSGSSDGYSSTSSIMYSSASSTVSSSSSSITASSSSSEQSSVASSASSTAIVIDPLPVTHSITNIGGTYIAKGQASILLAVNNTLAIAQQDRTQMTLYIFDNDTVGVSNCTTSGCITAWPPLLADNNAAAAAPFTIITRADGNKQWALRDKPLYFFVGDTKPNDINGEGVNNAWHVATYEPVLRNKQDINANDGEYLTAVGKINIGLPVTGSTTSFNSELQDRTGFSLYTFDNDTANVSNCSGNCLVAWPPLLADVNDKAEFPYTIIDRSMGGNATAKQWAYQGKPLYFYVGDSAAGETKGKALNRWHLARTLPVKVASNTTYGSFISAAGLLKSAAPAEGVEKITSVAKHGFSLYTFDNDAPGTSNCSGNCLTNWPALMADDGAVAQPPYTLVARSSGKFQWAINGMPLYFFNGDTNAGETKGDAVGNVWHLARIAPVVAKQHSTKGLLFTAHGNLVTDSGAADSTHQNFTLYTFDADPVGSTTCFNACLTTWPALYAAADATAFGDFSIIVRDTNTGVKQWAYKGKPLYFFAGDAAAGDTLGEYPSWTIARP